MNRKSVQLLETFIRQQYINNPSMASGDMSVAIRDCLTDLFHLGDEYKADIRKRMEDAHVVFLEEDNLNP